MRYRSNTMKPAIENARREDPKHFVTGWPGGGGGVALPYMGYIGTCRGIGYGFWRFSILK